MSIEAMKQMVEALEKADTLCPVNSEAEIFVRLAIEEGRKAIADSEQFNSLLVHQPMIELWQRYCDKKQEVDDLKEKLEAIDKQEPVAYAPYGVFDAWLDQAWLGVRCLNPQLCDPDKVDVQPIYAYPKPLREPLVGALLHLFQEWKEDHLSQSNYIDCVEGIKAAHGIKKETP